MPEANPNPPVQPPPRILRRAITVCCLLAFSLLAVPKYVIQPFRAQGAGELVVALFVQRWGPWLALAIAAVAVAAAVVVWRHAAGWRARAATATLTGLTVLFAGLSHVDLYEFVFHPAGNPLFVAADRAAVESDDMVLAVTLGGEARAYPIRIMGYHHIVNDRVGGASIAVTY